MVQKHVHIVDLVKSFPTNISFLLAKFSFGTAENEPSQILLIPTALGHKYRSEHLAEYCAGAASERKSDDSAKKAGAGM